MSGPHVFTLPSGVPFLPALADGLTARWGPRLEDALILLPTRRAVRQLGEAFVTEGMGASPTARLLPRIRTLADIDPDEPPFEPDDLATRVAPAIDPVLRRFELAKIIAFYHAKTSDLPLSPAAALALTDPLLQILDDTAMEEISPSQLDGLSEIEAFAAQHFQNASVLYKIIQTYWPARLRELGVIEPMTRRVNLLNTLTEIWTHTPPDHPVIIAGSTGTLGASARLMRCVAHMSEGMIILPGLDKNIRSTAWDKIHSHDSPGHPQNALKNLLSVIGIKRGDVKDWPHRLDHSPQNIRARRQVISESLVPISETDDWPTRIKTLRAQSAEADIFETALDGLSMIEARTDEEEAQIIALILREALLTPDMSAALVTPDPALARRVRAKLGRWRVNVDNSAGEPLEETALGAFLAALIRGALSPDAHVEQAVILKHALCGLNLPTGEARTQWEHAERTLFRHPRPPENIETPDISAKLCAALAPLTQMQGLHSTSDWARTLAHVTEAIAQTDTQDGASRLWHEDAGEKGAAMLEDMIAYGDIFDPMPLLDFQALLSTLMRGRVVRPRYGTHPRLSILSPIEARMLSVDRIILGGLNEGVWPTPPPIHPFLSRGMRQKIGLSLPERRLGLAAHDFAVLASNPDVILTRAERNTDGPMVASRWVWRLQTLIRGAFGATQAAQRLVPPHDYTAWARQLDQVDAKDVKLATRPEPRPPLEARWPKARKVSVTEMKTWIRDPYSIYAKYVLDITPLEPLGHQQTGALDARGYGNAVHKGLERFSRAWPNHLPAQAAQALYDCLEQALLEAGYPPTHLAKDKARLHRSAHALTEWMRARQKKGWRLIEVENKGHIYFEDVDFTLSGIADRIEQGPEGYAVIDYKTGEPATEAVVRAGFDPQLPLTAAMITGTAFKGVPAGPTHELLYVRIRGSDTGMSLHPITHKDHAALDYQTDAVESLRALVTEFDHPDTAYYAQPRAQFTHDYGVYDDLARRGEWAQIGPDTDGTS